MQRLTFARGAFWSLFASVLSVGTVTAADVTWTLTSGTATFGGRERIGIAGPFIFLEQAPGSLTTTLSGTYRTTDSFLSTLDFGAEPVHPGAPDDDDYAGGTSDPQYIADVDTWANVTLPASAAVQNKVVFGNSGSWGPGVLPLATVFDPPFPPPGSAPANFGAIGYDDFFDPQNPGQNPLSFRDNRLTFWTNKTEVPGDAEDPLMYPTGAPVDLTPGADYGTFESGVATHNSVAYIDSYLVGLDGFGFAGRLPTEGSDRNSATQKSVIGRNGSAYTMTLYYKLDIDLVGVIGVADSADFVVTIDAVMTATANVIEGDANFDGVVDIFDVNLVSDNWGGTGNLTPGDVNGDGTVDIFDVNMISDNWGETAGGAAAVPEPASFALLACAAVGTLWWARRRQ